MRNINNVNIVWEIGIWGSYCRYDEG